MSIGIYTVLGDTAPVARELTRIYLTLRGPNVGGGLPPMAASGPTRMLD